MANPLLPLWLRLAKMRIEHHIPRDVTQWIKDTLYQEGEQQMEEHRQAWAALVQPHLPVGLRATDIMPRFGCHMDPQLQRQNAEFHMVRATGAYVEPVKRELGSRKRGAAGDIVETYVAYDSPLDKTLEAMFMDPTHWAAVKAFEVHARSTNWANLTEEKYGADLHTQMGDVTQGVEYARFMRRLLTRLQPGEIPLVFFLL